MRRIDVFDIPIYRLKREDYESEMANAVEEHVFSCYEGQGLSRKENEYHAHMLGEMFRDRWGGPWKFNEIIGWLCLFTTGNGVGGNLWWVEGKRLSRMMKKKFFFRGMENVLNAVFPHDCPSDEVFRITMESIEAFARTPRMKRRYIDISAFKAVGPFINWRELANTIRD